MKRSRLAVALLSGVLLVPLPTTAAGSGVAAAPAPAGPVPTVATVASGVGVTRYLFMVRNVQFTGDIYTGRFTVIRKTGKRVVGAYGMFYSEARCLKGHIHGRWLIGRLPGFTYGGEWVSAVRMVAKWRGTGARQHMKGWTPVTASDMSRLSGGGVDGTIVESICSSL